jgi:hypothetical protein
MLNAHEPSLLHSPISVVKAMNTKTYDMNAVFGRTSRVETADININATKEIANPEKTTATSPCFR